MKKLKLSICALLILSGLHVATPLQAAWYWPQTRTQQILALAGLIAASYLSYLGQAYYRGTVPFTQAMPEPMQPGSEFDVHELEGPVASVTSLKETIEKSKEKEANLKEIKTSTLKKRLTQYGTNLSKIKKLPAARSYVEKTIAKKIDKLLQEYKFSENNKYWLESLSLGSLAVTENEQLADKDIKAFIELINQTINNLK